MGYEALWLALCFNRPLAWGPKGAPGEPRGITMGIGYNTFSKTVKLVRWMREADDRSWTYVEDACFDHLGLEIPKDDWRAIAMEGFVNSGLAPTLTSLPSAAEDVTISELIVAEYNLHLLVQNMRQVPEAQKAPWWKRLVAA